MAERRSPTVSRRRLVAELRRLRESVGLKGVDVAAQLGWSTSKISRLEKGQILPHREDVNLLMKAYAVPPDLRNLLLELTAEAEQRGWWEMYSDTFPESLITYIGLEAGAESLVTWQHYIFPGLLQTPNYARAVNRSPYPRTVASPGEIERRTSARLRRQALLIEDPAMRFLAVIDESVLCRRFGSEDVMGDQLLHVLEMAQLPNVTVHVFALGSDHSRGPSNFVILRFPSAGPLRTVYDRAVYLEGDAGAMLIEDEEETYNYEMFAQLMIEGALGEEESLEMIARFAHRWRNGA